MKNWKKDICKAAFYLGMAGTGFVLLKGMKDTFRIAEQETVMAVQSHIEPSPIWQNDAIKTEILPGAAVWLALIAANRWRKNGLSSGPG